MFEEQELVESNDTPVAEPQDEQEAPQQEEIIQARPTAQQENFRALREKAERAERERDELYRRLQQAEAQKAEPEEDFSLNVKEEDLVEGKHLSKVNRKIDRRIKQLEDQINRQQQAIAESSVETRLKVQYSDWDNVVNAQNIEMLKSEYPELAQTIVNSNADLYGKGVSAYTLIKKLGIMPQENTALDKLRVQTNAAKPKPLSTVAPQQGDSPLSRANAFANGLTDDLRKQLHKEMTEARKGY